MRGKKINFDSRLGIERLRNFFHWFIGSSSSSRQRYQQRVTFDPKGSNLNITGAINSTTPYDRKSNWWKETTEAVTDCLVKDMMSITIMET